MEPKQENGVGPVIAVIIIVVMMILGGLYFLSQRTSDENATPTPNEENVDEITASINTQSSSDESSAIEEDLNNTEVDSLDASLETN